DRSQEKIGLQQAFFELRLLVRIPHDATADPQAPNTVRDLGRANGYVEDRLLIRTHPADRPAVNAPRTGLEPLDDLHGAYAGCPGHGSTGEERFKDVVVRRSLAQAAFDDGRHLNE